LDLDVPIIVNTKATATGRFVSNIAILPNRSKQYAFATSAMQSEVGHLEQLREFMAAAGIGLSRLRAKG